MWGSTFWFWHLKMSDFYAKAGPHTKRVNLDWIIPVCYIVVLILRVPLFSWRKCSGSRQVHIGRHRHWYNGFSRRWICCFLVHEKAKKADEISKGDNVPLPASQCWRTWGCHSSGATPRFNTYTRRADCPSSTRAAGNTTRALCLHARTSAHIRPSS